MQLIETVTPRNRGERSERKTVLKLLKMGIDHRAIFHDCYIRKASGAYTQVDLVVATRAGLLAFEIKDYYGFSSILFLLTSMSLIFACYCC